ncbi:MAG: cytochrome c oxidase assembly protein [Solirubrobacteraceae bacterium]
MSAPFLPTLVWTGWEPTWSLDVEAALAASLYLTAVQRLRMAWPKRYTAAFLAGIAGVLVATQSGIEAFDDRMLSDHMIQHLILLELAPLLLLAGHPGALLLRSIPRSATSGLVRRFQQLRPVIHPLSCLLIFYMVIGFTHMPWFYDATLRNGALHDLEHALYLAAGVLMWWPVVDADPMPRHRLTGFARLGYVIAAMLPMEVIGAFLSRDTTVFYAGYGPPARALGVSAVLDQQQAGAIMWVVGGTLMVAVGLWQAMAAMVDEERRLQVRERRLVETIGPEP